MELKKNDIVKVITGVYRGKTGKIIRVFPESSRVMVEGINVYKKHVRSKKAGQKGEVVNVPRSINASNIMLYCSGCGKGVRIGFRIDVDKKVRICKKCQKTI